MKTQHKGWFFVLVWLIAAASGLFAQTEPVLNDSIVQNFVKNLKAIDEVFLGMGEESDFPEFAVTMNEFQESLSAYLYGGDDDFSAFRTAFIRIKSARTPGVEQVFSTFGFGRRGIEAFFVITLGMTISLMENEIEAVVSGVDPDTGDDPEDLSRLADIQNKLAMIRSLIHPDDMAVLKKNLDALLGLFLDE
jgi:hypothetical protein